MRESDVFQALRAEGKIAGFREGMRMSLVDVLETRFGTSAADEFAALVKDVTDTAQLRDLLRLASKARSLAAFRRALTSRVP